MIRVLHVVESVVAGVRTYLQALLGGLDRSVFRLAVACPPRRVRSYGDQGFAAFLQQAGIASVPLILHPGIHARTDLAALGKLITVIRGGQYHVVHLHSSKAGAIGRVAARLAGRPAVIYSPHALAFLGDHGPLARRFYLAIEQLAGRLCDRMIAVSASERQTIIAHGLVAPERVVQIENGVVASQLPPDYDRLALRRQLGVPPGATLIGTAARLAPQKNPQLFVDAAAELVAVWPDAYFVWAGDGELRAATERHIGARGLAGRLRLLGHREDVAAIIAACDLFWLTSNYESFGLATVEAMALERPVVATDVQGTRDIVVAGETGLLVPPRDPRALAQASLHLIADPQRAAALAAAGRKRALERYSVERMVQQTAELYVQIARQPHAHVRASWSVL